MEIGNFYGSITLDTSKITVLKLGRIGCESGITMYYIRVIGITTGQKLFEARSGSNINIDVSAEDSVLLSASGTRTDGSNRDFVIENISV